jgi:hypothetical protein
VGVPEFGAGRLPSVGLFGLPLSVVDRCELSTKERDSKTDCSQNRLGIKGVDKSV